MGSRLARTGLALLVLLSVAGTAGATAGTTADRRAQRLASSDDVKTLELVYTVERLPERPGKVRVTLRPDLPNAVERLRIGVGDRGNVTGHTGFVRLDGHTWEWRRGRGPPSLTYVADVNRSGDAGYDAVDTADWTLTSRYRKTVGVTFRYWYRGATVQHLERIEPKGAGVSGVNNVYLGAYSTANRSGDDQRFRLVIPESSNMRSTPDDVLDSLSAASSELRVGARDEQVTVFVAPHPMRGGGQTSEYSTAVGQDSWVGERSRVDSPNNVWVHEYVHTRQAYVPDAEMEWFDEASAEYYAALLTLNEGRTDFESFRSHVLAGRDADQVLTDRSSWDHASVEYRKGSQVLAALDAEIRVETDGRHTLQDVLRRMNRRDGAITEPVFHDIVADVVGHRMDGWLDRYLDTSAVPAVPDAPGSYVLSAGTDPDGDGLNNERETAHSTSPFARDTDGDGLTDGREADLGTNATRADTDGDGIPDGDEVARATDPTLADTDGDGLDDGAELDRGTDPTTVDTDGDGLADGREVEIGTDPLLADSDGDSVADGTERRMGSDPLAVDTDGDDVGDGAELDRGTDPTSVDTDGDGIDDDREAQLGTDPTRRTGVVSYYLSMATTWIFALFA